MRLNSMTSALVVIILALSAGLAFVSMRRFEESRGIRLFNERRVALDSYASSLWEALVLGGIPVAWRKHAALLIHGVTHEGVRQAVEVVRAVERPLARLSYKMRVSAPKGAGAPVSDFLKTITPDKTGNGDFREKSV